jgi:hypothetical protein
MLIERVQLPEPPVPGRLVRHRRHSSGNAHAPQPSGLRPVQPRAEKSPKRVETLFSQLCDQFMIRRNYAKSFQGLSTRILSKLTALTLIQWLNQRNGSKLNNLKIVIA